MDSTSENLRLRVPKGTDGHQTASWGGFADYRGTPIQKRSRRTPEKIFFGQCNTPFRMCLKKPIFFLCEKYQFYIGPMLHCSEHTHHALQIMIALDEKLTVSLSGGSEQDCKGVIMAPNVPHETRRSSGMVLLILIDAETAQAKRLKTQFLKNRDVHPFGHTLVNAIIENFPDWNGDVPDAHRMRALYTYILDVIESVGKRPIKNSDERMPLILDYIRSLEVKKISAKSIAEKIYLSESRLIHLFKNQTGITIRRYLLWVRFKAAVRLIAQGCSYTCAAHSVGFSDSAHLSRTARKLFGMSLTSVFGPGKPEGLIVLTD